MLGLDMEKMITASDIKLFVTDSAIRQIQVMKENDYTLDGLCFRIKIGGKGCEGLPTRPDSLRGIPMILS